MTNIDQPNCLNVLKIIILITLSQSCTKGDYCNNKDLVTYYNIEDSNKAKMPYNTGDTIVFISDENDTLPLIAQGKITLYENVTKNLSSNPDCPINRVSNYELLSCYFINNNSKITNTNLFISKFNDSGGDPITTTIDFNLNFSNISTSSIEYLESNKSQHDSILLNGNFINGVYMEYNSKKTLFNFKFGIL